MAKASSGDADSSGSTESGAKPIKKMVRKGIRRSGRTRDAVKLAEGDTSSGAVAKATAQAKAVGKSDEKREGPTDSKPAVSVRSGSGGAAGDASDAPAARTRSRKKKSDDAGGARDDEGLAAKASGGDSTSVGLGGGNAGGQSGSHGVSQGASSGGSGGGSSGSGGGFDGDGDSAGSRRRKRKRRKAGLAGPTRAPGQGHGHSHSHAHSHDFTLPSDEQLEREAQELEAAIKKATKQDLADAIRLDDLQRMSLEGVFKVAEGEGLEDFHAIHKPDLIMKILKARAARQGLMFGEGTLEIMPDGFGFLRSPEFSYLPGPDDIYVSPTHVRRFGLRRGMVVKGAIRPPRESERYFALLRVEEVNGRDPKAVHDIGNFEDLTPLHPEERFVLETEPDSIEMRVVDLVSPIGKGQRALIVAPPRTGKTVILQKITKAISTNYPHVKVIVLLVDERPEEVTDFRRNTDGRVEVVASTFDEHSSRHVAVAETVINKAKRMVEFGDDVVILLDSITRLARAYNNEIPHSGKIMTGGLDSNALQRPKKFFGAARAIEAGGSLTIIGTALVDTGSKMDEVIFEEFKGTGNAELHLDRKLVEKRIWPAIDVSASGTRREELLMDAKELELVYRLRKVLADMNVVESMELLKTRLKKFKTNAEFLMNMAMS